MFLIGIIVAKFFNRGQPKRLGRVAKAIHNEKPRGDANQTGNKHGTAPAVILGTGGHDEGNEIAPDVVRCIPKAPPTPALRMGIPMGEELRTTRPTPTLEKAVETPKKSQGPKKR